MKKVVKLMKEYQLSYSYFQFLMVGLSKNIPITTNNERQLIFQLQTERIKLLHFD